MDRRTALFGAAALAVAPSVSYVNAAETSGGRVFKLLRDGDDIGRHAISVVEDGELLRVSIEIDIAVRFLGFVGYRYEHSNTEIWRGGALESADSTTNDDGDAYRVSVKRDGDELVVDATEFSGRAPGDAAPTSYWNKDSLDKTVWIDTQAGSLLTKTSKRIGFDDRGLERWDIDGDLTLSLFYDTLGEWRGSEFDGQGHIIRYEEIEPGRAFRSLI